MSEEKKIRVSIFEDNKSLRESLGFLIAHEPDFVLAGLNPNAKKLKRNIEDQQPDVILMDIQMPGINGIEAVSIIHQQFPEIRVVMQTVFEDDDYVFKAICNGAVGFILKSATPEKYIEAIREAQAGGAALSPSIAIKVLSQFQNRKEPEKEKYDELTDREKEVLQFLVQGLSYKMIADRCTISYETVRFHMKNIYLKLHVASMTEAVSKAIRNKIV
jgi:DNA-binding NarL/FixJ family response regulator